MGFGFLVGGALSGIGNEMADQAKLAMQARLLELEHNYRASDAATEHGYQLDTLDHADTLKAGDEGRSHVLDLDTLKATHANRLGEIGAETAGRLREIGASNAGEVARQQAGFAHDDAALSTTTTDANGNIIGITRNGKTINLGIKKGGITDDDKDLLTRVETQFSAKRDQMDTNPKSDTYGQKIGSETVIDTKGVADRLIGLHRPDLARIYTATGSTPAKPSTPTAPPPGTMGPDGTMTPSTAMPNSGIPLPGSLLNEPDGTVVTKGGSYFKKQGNLLVPTVKPPGM